MEQSRMVVSTYHTHKVLISVGYRGMKAQICQDILNGFIGVQYQSRNWWSDSKKGWQEITTRPTTIRVGIDTSIPGILFGERGGQPSRKFIHRQHEIRFA
jgi:hypothetical protein